MVKTLEPLCSGSANTNMSLSTLPAGKVNRPASAIGTTNRLIRNKIERIEPSGALDFTFVVIFDDGDMELTRQQDYRHE